MLVVVMATFPLSSVIPHTFHFYTLVCIYLCLHTCNNNIASWLALVNRTVKDS